MPTYIPPPMHRYLAVLQACVIDSWGQITSLESAEGAWGPSGPPRSSHGQAISQDRITRLRNVNQMSKNFQSIETICLGEISGCHVLNQTVLITCSRKTNSSDQHILWTICGSVSTPHSVQSIERFRRLVQIRWFHTQFPRLRLLFPRLCFK